MTTFQVVCYTRDGATWSENHVSLDHVSPSFAVKVAKGLNRVARREGLAGEKQYLVPSLCPICQLINCPCAG